MVFQWAGLNAPICGRSDTRWARQVQSHEDRKAQEGQRDQENKPHEPGVVDVGFGTGWDLADQRARGVLEDHRLTTEDAHDLAIVLRAGALPAPVNIIEERTVGPSLGADSIRKGLISMCIGGIFVILFMIIYYKGSGIIADIALILNILIIAGGLAGFQATLTLPGIAGIILTIGMAVDANVLIFERIREEMTLGKTPRAAVDAGYSRATLTILDANVTTLIAALVLFQFGTGPVKGFAVTLSLGVLASLFTALILSRTIFEYFLVKRKVRTISI